MSCKENKHSCDVCRIYYIDHVLFAAGVAILVLNHVYGASMTNNLRSSAVFIGGSLALAGMITLAARFFSAEGAPYYRAGHSYLRYDRHGLRLLPGLRLSLLRRR